MNWNDLLKHVDPRRSKEQEEKNSDGDNRFLLYSIFLFAFIIIICFKINKNQQNKMNEQLKTNRVEVEAKLQEKQIMRNAVIKKMADKPLIDRIKFIIEHSAKKQWSAIEMTNELNEKGILPVGVTVIDVADVMKENFNKDSQ